MDVSGVWSVRKVGMRETVCGEEREGGGRVTACFLGGLWGLWGFMGVYGGLWGFRDFQGTSVSAALLLHQETCQLLLLPACQVAALLQSSLPATACPLTPVLHLKPCYGLAAKP